MSKLFTALIFSMFCAQSFAASTYVSCSNGSFQETGDSHFVANFFDDSIVFNIFEGHVGFSLEDMTWKGQTTAIMDVTLDYHVEGEKEEVLVNALITMAKDYKSAQVTYSFDHEPFRSLDLKCKTVPYKHHEID